MRRIHPLFVVSIIAFAAACGAQANQDIGGGYGEEDGGGSENGNGEGGTTGTGDGTGDAGSSKATGDAGSTPASDCAPPDVLALMQKDCQTSGCHSGNPSAPPLLSYANLTAKSKVDPTKSVAERALARMQDKTSPMPPSGQLAAATIAPFQTWVNGGMKPVACTGSVDGGVDAGPSEFDVPAKCTNGQSTAGEGSTMDPGRACGGCHGFSVAGTVYPTAHEPNNCKGVAGSGAAAGTKVVVTDSKGKSTQLTVNSAGNFLSSSSFSAPFTVKVVAANGHERSMLTKLTSSMGDCNSCHTQSGTGNPKAPGRILMPQ
jgi:cytochrome c553